MADDSRLTFARGDVVSRKYEIENHLGDGVFGKTYLARHIASGRHVVVKFVKPELLSAEGASEQFKQGFNTAKRLRHPGLIRYGEINEHNGLTYITQEYFKSQNLRQVIDETINGGDSFTLQDACQIVIKVLEALSSGHESGLIHRNIKPENILVDTQRSGPGGKKLVRTIKVTDIGLIDMLDHAVIGDRYSSDFVTDYLAPELGGFGSAGSPQADIYSTGVMLYELLCGQVPRGTFLSPTQVRDDLPDHVDHLVELALSPDPADRYPTAKDMIRDIQRSFNLEMQEGGESGGGSRNVLLALLGALAAVALVGLYMGTRTVEDPNKEPAEQDQIIRQQMRKDNPLPDPAVAKTMQDARADMVWIPGGTYVSGRLRQEDSTMASPSEPLARVAEVDDFYVDRYEFPNRHDGVPVAKANWDDAKEACSSVGKRLCSAGEWEKACKGPDNYIYSYGDTWDGSFCGGAMDEQYTSGVRKECHSGYGVFDISGGFREWTADSPGQRESRKIVKGGQRGNPERGTRCAFSVDEATGYAEPTLGFRCCVSILEDGSAPPAPAAPTEGEEG